MQHFFTSVSSPVLGSILLTERQQNILLRHKPHLLCLGGPMGLNDCSSFRSVVDDNESTVEVFFLQFLQQFNFCQHEVFFGCISSTISRCVVVALLVADSTGRLASSCAFMDFLRWQQREQRESRHGMQNLAQQLQQPLGLPSSSSARDFFSKYSWLSDLENMRNNRIWKLRGA